MGGFFYENGWVLLKLITFGKHPNQQQLDKSRGEIYVCCVGVFAFCSVPNAYHWPAQSITTRLTITRFSRWAAKKLRFGRP